MTYLVCPRKNEKIPAVEKSNMFCHTAPSLSVIFWGKIRKVVGERERGVSVSEGERKVPWYVNQGGGGGLRESIFAK